MHAVCRRDSANWYIERRNVAKNKKWGCTRIMVETSYNQDRIYVMQRKQQKFKNNHSSR